jgi:hypothetical protein
VSDVATTAGAYSCAVEYAPTHGADYKLKPLWSGNRTLSADSTTRSAEFDLMRLRGGVEYTFHVWLSVDGAAATLLDSKTATVPKTGFPRFDDAPLATISGGVPSWQMLSMVRPSTAILARPSRQSDPRRVIGLAPPPRRYGAASRNQRRALRRRGRDSGRWTRISHARHCACLAACAS